MIVFAKGAGWQMDRLATLPCEALGVDWHMPVAEARRKGPEHVFQGNLDPSVLWHGSRGQAATQQMLADFGRGKHVANLGHGVCPTSIPIASGLIDEIQRSGVRVSPP